ncbi:MAG: competence type IV pilus major pilin ComGC [Armatimonadota bacterium]
MHQRKDNGFGLIEMMVVVVIIALLAIYMLPRYLGSKDTLAGKGGITAPIQKAESVDCLNNLQQIRNAVTMYQNTNEQNPSSLADLSASGISESHTKCPISAKPYNYDPSQGAVSCSTPGHERY